MLRRLFGQANRDEGFFRLWDRAGNVHLVPRVLLTMRPGMTRDEAIAMIAPFDRYGNAGRSFVNSDEDWPVHFTFDVVKSIGYSAFAGPEAVVDGIYNGMPFDEALRLRPDLAVDTALAQPPGFTRYFSAPGSATPFDLSLFEKDGRVCGFTIYPAGEALARAQRMEKFREKEARRQDSVRWQTLTDPTERLLGWAKTSEYWGQVDDRFVWYAKRLLAATPDEWHDAASHWNWDYGREPLRWIISQPNCDTATAKLVFQGLSAGYGPEDVGDDTPASIAEDIDLIHAIVTRWRTGFWTASELAFIPDSDEAPARAGETAMEAAFRELNTGQPGRTVPDGVFLKGCPVEYDFS